MGKSRRGYRKVRAGPGSVSTPINPGFGAMGPHRAPGSNTRPGGISGRAPTGPNPVPPGSGQRGGNPDPNGSQSKYSVLPPQPSNDITDVDLGLNWFSPFQPVTPFGPPYVGYAREWDYPVGTNLDYIPQRFNLFGTLRGMAETWGVLRTVIETRKDQVLRLPWEFQVRGKPRAKSKGIDELNKFFKKPDGKVPFDTWMRMLLEDLFVIDAPAIYMGYQDRRGRPLSLDILDGATIKPLIDDAGRRPDFPQPAYQQIIKGLPMINMDEQELLYSPMRPRTSLPIFGYSPVEHIYIEVTEAIRKTFYQLNFWVDGNLPDLLMSVPETWTPRQIAQFQALMDANLSGNLREKSKMRFVPHGMQPYDIKNASGQDTWATRDEVLIRLVCFAFSISPQPFIKQMNRATAQSATEDAAQEGLYPLVQYLTKNIMNPLVERLGYDDIDWVVLPQPEVDQLKRSQVYMNYAKAGLWTINEIRDDMGKPPVEGGDEPLVYTNNGVMTLKDAIAAGKMAIQAPPGGSDGPSTSGINPGPAMRNPQQTQARNPPQVDKNASLEDQQGLEETDAEGNVIPLFG